MRKHDQIRAHVVQQLIESHAALVEHGLCHGLFGMARRKRGEKNLPRLVPRRLHFHHQPAAINHIGARRTGLHDFQARERIRRMIAKRIGKAGDFNGADPEHRRQHCRKTKQSPRRALEMAAQFIRARKFLDGHAAHLGAIIFHRLPRQIARQRRK